MNTEVERPSAVIYQFPVRRRANAQAQCGFDAAPVYEAVATDSWYHAEAIRTSEPVQHS